MSPDRSSPSLDAQAQMILRANDRGGYTVPSARLYPFQWNWDSPLTAIGWACVDLDRAMREFEMLISGQWADGMIPHIIFHAPSDGYYPGPGAWGTNHQPPTSGITQPPVAATCLRRIVDGATDREAALTRARPLVAALFAWHRWWHEIRDPEGSGLVACLHPWETGRDNSLDWDAALAGVTPRVDVAGLRKDILHADPAERPTHDYYNRVMTLVEEGKSVAWDGPGFMRRSSFRVCDLGIQCLLVRADEDLTTLAIELGMTEEAASLERWRVRSIAAMARLWDPASRSYHSIDLRTGLLAKAISVGTFLPLYAGAVDRAQAGALAELMRGTMLRTRYVAPTTQPWNDGYDPKRYWRGPVWPFMNRILADGFLRYGFADIAQRLHDDTRDLILRGGFREYFHPETGEGLGGGDFSWTAATWLVWAGQDIAA